MARLPVGGGSPAAIPTPLSGVYAFGACAPPEAPTVRLASVPTDLRAVLCIASSASGELDAVYLLDAGQIDRDSASAAFEHGAIFLSERPLQSPEDVRSLDAGAVELSVTVGSTKGVAGRLGPGTYRVDWRRFSGGNPIEVILIGGRSPAELLTLARTLVEGTPAVY